MRNGRYGGDIKMKDIEIYRMEEIRDEITELLGEAKVITAGCDDYIAVAQALVWITKIDECVNSENSHRLTIQKTIDDFWKDYYDEE